MYHFVESLPISTENLILILRIMGICFGFLSVALLFHAVHLSNTLSIAKAKQFLGNEYRPPVELTEANMPAFDLPQNTATSRQKVVCFTISEEAQQFLEKLAVSVSYENGWCGSNAPVRRIDP